MAMIAKLRAEARAGTGGTFSTRTFAGLALSIASLSLMI